MFVVLHQNTWQHNCLEISLLRVLLHRLTDTTEAEDRRFFKEVVDKSIRDAITKFSWTYSTMSWEKRFMGFQLVKVGRLITTFHIHRPKGPIKSVLAIKKQHRLVVVMFRQFKVHLNKLKELLQIRHSTILDHQYNMCNSQRGKVRTRWLILAHQATYCRRLRK